MVAEWFCLQKDLQQVSWATQLGIPGSGPGQSSPSQYLILNKACFKIWRNAPNNVDSFILFPQRIMVELFFLFQISGLMKTRNPRQVCITN